MLKTMRRLRPEGKYLYFLSAGHSAVLTTCVGLTFPKCAPDHFAQRPASPCYYPRGFDESKEKEKSLIGVPVR
jgi:hypothetical protein